MLVVFLKVNVSKLVGDVYTWLSFGLGLMQDLWSSIHKTSYVVQQGIETTMCTVLVL